MSKWVNNEGCPWTEPQQLKETKGDMGGFTNGPTNGNQGLTYSPTFLLLKWWPHLIQAFLWSRSFSMSTYNRVEGLCHILKFHFCWVTNLEGLEREQDFLLTFITDQAPPFYTTVKVGFSLLIGVNTLTFILFLSIFKEKHKENSAL